MRNGVLEASYVDDEVVSKRSRSEHVLVVQSISATHISDDPVSRMSRKFWAGVLGISTLLAIKIKDIPYTDLSGV